MKNVLLPLTQFFFILSSFPSIHKAFIHIYFFIIFLSFHSVPIFAMSPFFLLSLSFQFCSIFHLNISQYLLRHPSLPFSFSSNLSLFFYFSLPFSPSFFILPYVFHSVFFLSFSSISYFLAVGISLYHLKFSISPCFVFQVMYFCLFLIISLYSFV